MTNLYYSFQFPANKRAAKTTAADQAAKVIEEAHETAFAIRQNEKAIRICEEAYDVIVAAEGLLNKFPMHTQDAAFRVVMEKGKDRDDWEPWHE